MACAEGIYGGLVLRKCDTLLYIVYYGIDTSMLIFLLQSARLGDGNSVSHGESNECDGNTEEGGSDDADSNTRRVIIKTVQSDNVTKTDVIKLNSNNNSQTGGSIVKKGDGDIFGVPVPVNGKHSGANGDVKKNSIVKILEGSNTKVLTAQEGKSLLSLGKTTSARVLYNTFI